MLYTTYVCSLGEHIILPVVTVQVIMTSPSTVRMIVEIPEKLIVTLL